MPLLINFWCCKSDTAAVLNSTLRSIDTRIRYFTCWDNVRASTAAKFSCVTTRFTLPQPLTFSMPLFNAFTNSQTFHLLIRAHHIERTLCDKFRLVLYCLSSKKGSQISAQSLCTSAMMSSFYNNPGFRRTRQG